MPPQLVPRPSTHSDLTCRACGFFFSFISHTKTSFRSRCRVLHDHSCRVVVPGVNFHFSSVSSGGMTTRDDINTRTFIDNSVIRSTFVLLLPPAGISHRNPTQRFRLTVLRSRPYVLEVARVSCNSRRRGRNLDWTLPRTRCDSIGAISGITAAVVDLMARRNDKNPHEQLTQKRPFITRATRAIPSSRII